MSISAIRPTGPTAATSHPMRRAGDFVVDKDSTIANGTTAEADSVALTRTEPPLRLEPVSSRSARPDASFVVHLIATAEQAPQTRALRRAAVADVEAAYRAVANQNVSGSSAGRTRLMA